MDVYNMWDIVAIGELLIDFAPGGVTKEGAMLFERNPGGAPANVLAMVSRLGMKTAFITKVGEDAFGLFLTDVLRNINIETTGVVYTKEANTTLAFVSLDKNGDRSFSFYRNPGADMLLASSEVKPELVKDCRIFHFGTVSMTDNPSREATLFAVKTAKEAGALISFDPNLRPLLWKNLTEAKSMMIEGLRFADILKVSEEELEFITGIKDLTKGSSAIKDQYGVGAILVTLGAAGCFYRVGDFLGTLPTYDVKTIDTTGAGDAFLGAFLVQYLECGKKTATLNDEDIVAMVDFANATGSLATTKKGAIPAMPSLEEIEECQKNIPKLILGQ